MPIERAVPAMILARYNPDYCERFHALFCPREPDEAEAMVDAAVQAVAEGRSPFAQDRGDDEYVL